MGDLKVEDLQGTLEACEMKVIEIGNERQEEQALFSRLKKIKQTTILKEEQRQNVNSKTIRRKMTNHKLSRIEKILPRTRKEEFL